MHLRLEVWRQSAPAEPGRFQTYDVADVSGDMSMLEVLDVLNGVLLERGEEPVAFDHDCREGICGSCGFMVDGIAHGPLRGTTVCQLYMREFREGARIVLEPWRARAFPVIKDLVVDRGAFDRLIAAGGFISVPVGSAPEANTPLVPRPTAERALDAASCIGCGACVAACPNASASLFAGSKVAHLGLLPQGDPERARRVIAMVRAANDEGFGHCTFIGECEAACPANIRIEVIARMNLDFLKASLAPGSTKVAYGMLRPLAESAEGAPVLGSHSGGAQGGNRP
jgi:succinate dehydrogenase / fumarate reductase, iron-sulfur subunit